MATATLPSPTEPRPTTGEWLDDGEFYLYSEWVPVFKEHENEGHGLDFDNEAMRKICLANNDRIENTGDFPPLVIRHNKEGGDGDQPVVGFGGPFKVGPVGKKKPVAGILSRLRVFKKDLALVKRYPRISVEYWCPKDDPFAGYFDPISLLGSETPELDLGIRYGKDRAGREWNVIRYSKLLQFEAAAAFPGGDNTFVPSTGNEKKKQYAEIRYGKKGDSVFASDDIHQLIEALKPVITEIVAELSGPGGKNAEGSMPGAAIPPASPITPAPEDVSEQTPIPFKKPDEGAMSTTHDEDCDEAKKLAAECGGMGKAAMKYKKEHDDVRLKYEKLVRDNAEKDAKIAELETKATQAGVQGVRAMRFAKLSDLRNQGFIFDPEEEIKDWEPADASDQVFDRHIERIKVKYQRAPVGRPLIHEPAQMNNPVAGDNEQLAKYAAEAVKRIEAGKRDGHRLDYKKVLQEVAKENGVTAAV